MNPLLQSFLASILRWLLTAVGTWFVAKGIVRSDEIETYIAGAIAAILALVWGLYQKYRSKLFADKAREMSAGVSETAVKAAIKHDRTLGV
jgi:membrane protein DedA with SNARE-associated domain